MLKHRREKRKTTNLTSITCKTYLKIFSDDEQAEHSAVQNETVLGIIGR